MSSFLLDNASSSDFIALHGLDQTISSLASSVVGDPLSLASNYKKKESLEGLLTLLSNRLMWVRINQRSGDGGGPSHNNNNNNNSNGLFTSLDIQVLETEIMRTQEALQRVCEIVAMQQQIQFDNGNDFSDLSIHDSHHTFFFPSAPPSSSPSMIGNLMSQTPPQTFNPTINTNKGTTTCIAPSQSNMNTVQNVNNGPMSGSMIGSNVIARSSNDDRFYPGIIEQHLLSDRYLVRLLPMPNISGLCHPLNQKKSIVGNNSHHTSLHESRNNGCFVQCEMRYLIPFMPPSREAIKFGETKVLVPSYDQHGVFAYYPGTIHSEGLNHEMCVLTADDSLAAAPLSCLSPIPLSLYLSLTGSKGSTNNPSMKLSSSSSSSSSRLNEKNDHTAKPLLSKKNPPPPSHNASPFPSSTLPHPSIGQADSIPNTTLKKDGVEQFETHVVSLLPPRTPVAVKVSSIPPCHASSSSTSTSTSSQPKAGQRWKSSSYSIDKNDKTKNISSNGNERYERFRNLQTLPLDSPSHEENQAYLKALKLAQRDIKLREEHSFKEEEKTRKQQIASLVVKKEREEKRIANDAFRREQTITEEDRKTEFKRKVAVERKEKLALLQAEIDEMNSQKLQFKKERCSKQLHSQPSHLAPSDTSSNKISSHVPPPCPPLRSENNSRHYSNEPLEKRVDKAFKLVSSLKEKPLRNEKLQAKDDEVLHQTHPSSSSFFSSGSPIRRISFSSVPSKNNRSNHKVTRTTAPLHSEKVDSLGGYKEESHHHHGRSHGEEERDEGAIVRVQEKLQAAKKVIERANNLSSFGEGSGFDARRTRALEREMTQHERMLAQQEKYDAALAFKQAQRREREERRADQPLY